MKVDIILGLQFGSEGKGLVSAFLEQYHRYDWHLRGGSCNAGHKFKHKGKEYIFRHIPSHIPESDTKLGIVRGALINKEILHKEIIENNIKRIYVDEGVYPIYESDIKEERELKQRIGSTGEGVGYATAMRILRKPRIIMRYIPNIKVCNIQNAVRTKNVLLEGTQGAGLSIYSDYYPYCTSRDVSVAGLMSEAQLPFNSVRDVYGVFRTFPIRVGGNSGPLNYEISWEEVSAVAGRPVIEKTTVTQKIRRVARIDFEQLKNAIYINGVTKLWITFLDYVVPEIYRIPKRALTRSSLEKCYRYISDIENILNVPVFGFSYGDSFDYLILKDEMGVK